MALTLSDNILHPVEGEPLTCAFCSHERARWLLKLAHDVESWCSICFLYDTEWGAGNAADRDFLILNTESALSSKITDQNGRLTIAGADRILSSVVFITAYKYASNRTRSKP